MKKLIIFTTMIMLMFTSAFAGTLTYNFSTLNNTNDLSFATTDVGIVNENNELVINLSVDNEFLFGDEGLDDATIPVSFANSLETYAGDLSTLTEYTVRIDYEITLQGDNDYGNLVLGLHPNQAYNFNWSGAEIQLGEALNNVKSFFYNDFISASVSYTDTPFTNEAVIEHYVNKNTNEYTISIIYPNLAITQSQTYNYTDFFVGTDASLTDMYLYGFTNSPNDIAILSNFTLNSPQIVFETPAPPTTVLGDTGLGDFTEEVMTGTGNGIMALAPGLIVLAIGTALGVGISLVFRQVFKKAK